MYQVWCASCASWCGPYVCGLVGWGVLGGGVGLSSWSHISLLPSIQHMVRTLPDLCCSEVSKDVCIMCIGLQKLLYHLRVLLWICFIMTYHR